MSVCLMSVMPQSGLSFGSRILRHLGDKQSFLYPLCRASTSSGETFARLKLFFEQEKEAIQEINEKFALPYVNVYDLQEDFQKKLIPTDTESLLLKSSYNGQLHQPAIPFSYIASHIAEVEKNLANRKMDGKFDVKKDIVEPHQRLTEIKSEKMQCISKKERLSQSMQVFWVNHDKDSEIPDDIVKKRGDVIFLGCKINLLSWMEQQIERKCFDNALLLPNLTHPESPVGDESAARVLKIVGEKPDDSVKSVGHMDVGEVSSTIRQSQLVNLSGLRTYYLFQQGAELEQALVRYALDVLKKRGFLLMSCPNILHGSVFEGCGIPVSKLPGMLYRIDPKQDKEFYISGTSEIGIAGYFANHAVPIKHLPLKICCISTCNRKETDSTAEAKGLYRVHHFTKVEMFGVTANETGSESEELFEEFQEIQELLFSNLGLHFRILDMPTEELALPAYRKVDMEAWMSHRASYGEISSTSNCTDFQSRRLHILYKTGNDYKFAHTINGTACAVPRVLLALYENNQKEKTVHLPEVLMEHMSSMDINRKSKIAMEYIGPNQSKKKQKSPKE